MCAQKTCQNVCMSNPQSLRLHSPPRDLNQCLVLDPPQCVDDLSVLSVCAQCLRPLMDDSSDLFHHNSQCIFIYLFSSFIVLTESFDGILCSHICKTNKYSVPVSCPFLLGFLKISVKFSCEQIFGH